MVDAVAASCAGCGPQVVVGVGGYASLPGVLAARLLRIPVVVHEQNAVPGLANRLAARLGARVAVSLPGTALRGRGGRPATRCGRRWPRSCATPDADRPLLGVVGGSLGSPRLNDAALDLYDRWRARGRRRGAPRRRDRGTTTRCRTRLERLRRPAGRARLRAGRRTRTTWSASTARASLAVCRAGAVTVAELAAAGVPVGARALAGRGRRPPDRQRPGDGSGRRGGAAARRAVRRRAARRGRRRAARRSRPAHDDVRTRRARWPAPTPPTGSRTWWRRRPVPAPEPGPMLDLTRAAPHPRRGRRRRGHERVRGDPRRDGPPGERLGPARAPALRAAAAASASSASCRRWPRTCPPDADAVVISSAVPRTNVEVRAAEAAGIPVLSRADALAGIVAARRGLGVAGTHGKTTTTSMITLIMRGGRTCTRASSSAASSTRSARTPGSTRASG